MATTKRQTSAISSSTSNSEESFDEHGMIEQATRYHGEVEKFDKQLTKMLYYAADSGEALIELKENARARKVKWGDWFNEHLADNMSHRTARVYMQIAREWESEAVLNAQRQGVTSIDGVLRAIRAAHQSSGKKGRGESQKPREEIAAKRTAVKKAFAKQLNSLPEEQLNLLAESNLAEILAKILQNLSNNSPTRQAIAA